MDLPLLCSTVSQYRPADQHFVAGRVAQDPALWPKEVAGSNECDLFIVGAPMTHHEYLSIPSNMINSS